METIQLSDNHMELVGYEEIKTENIVQALSVFFLSPELNQVSFTFVAGKQANVFFDLINSIKNSGVFLYQDPAGRTKAVDLMFIKDTNMMLKAYMSIKNTTKVIASFYEDDEHKYCGHLTFIKGELYE